MFGGVRRWPIRDVTWKITQKTVTQQYSFSLATTVFYDERQNIGEIRVLVISIISLCEATRTETTPIIDHVQQFSSIQPIPSSRRKDVSRSSRFLVFVRKLFNNLTDSSPRRSFTSSANASALGEKLRFMTILIMIIHHVRELESKKWSINPSEQCELCKFQRVKYVG